MSATALQEDVRVGEAEHCRLLVFMLQGQSEDFLIERLRALQVADDQVDSANLLLPFGHVTPLSLAVGRSWRDIGPSRDPKLIVEAQLCQASFSAPTSSRTAGVEPPKTGRA